MTGRHSLGHARTQRSFETLYHEHVGDVFRYALAVTGQTSDAEDVTQTTFLNAYRAYARGERPRKPQNWLLTIAHNVCRQRARFASYRVREVELEESTAEALAPPEDIPTAADIRRALSHLPFQQRAVLIMRELEGRTHAEIAETMGLTTQATEMLAFRARRALREHLAGSLTCTQAASALDRQLDGSIDAESAAMLRAHLRECEDCDRLARRMRAQQSAWKSLAVVPLPTSLHSFNGAGALANCGAAIGGASAGAGAGVAAKVAAVALAAVSVGSTGYVAKLQLAPTPHRPANAPVAHQLPRTTARPSHAHAYARVATTAPPPHAATPPVSHHSLPATPAAMPPPPAVEPTVVQPAVPSAPAVTSETPEPTATTDATATTDTTPTDTTQSTHPAHPTHPLPGTETNNGVRAHGSPTTPGPQTP